jgi:glycosyltransferase involved in cell wall biosynthesis
MGLTIVPSAEIPRRNLRDAAGSRLAPFSVLMTTYAGERAEFLEGALTSIVQQTLPAAQIVLVVDGPVDTAQQEVLDHGAEQASTLGTQFIQIDRSECGGLAVALNHGLRHCSEPWIARMDSDDHAPRHRLAMQWDFLVAHTDIDVLAGYQMEFSAQPEQVDRVKTLPELHDDIARVLRWRNTISHPSVVMRTDVVRRVGGYREIGLLEDYDLMLRLLAGGARFHGLQHATIHVRVDDAQRLRRGGARYALEELRFRVSMFRRGHISLANLAVSLPCYAAFRLCPPTVKRAAYRLVRRSTAPADAISVNSRDALR